MSTCLCYKYIWYLVFPRRRRAAPGSPSASSMWVTCFHGIRACPDTEHAPTALAMSAANRRPSFPPHVPAAPPQMRSSATREISAVGCFCAHPSVMERVFEVGFCSSIVQGPATRLHTRHPRPTCCPHCSSCRARRCTDQSIAVSSYQRMRCNNPASTGLRVAMLSWRGKRNQ